MNARTTAFIALPSFALALVLCLLRIESVFSLTHSVQNVTSGWEQESLFAIWKWIHDLPVYNDSHRLPFSISFYNWLFYQVYGPLTELLLGVFSASDEWIPTIGRTITFAGAVVGSVAAYFAYLAVATPEGGATAALKLMAASFAGLVFFGPLVGFWSFTVRTDMWTLMFEGLAILLFWRFYRTAPLLAVLACAAACYGAWGFKHVNVFTAATVGLWLLWRRDWRSAAVFAVVLGGAFAATLSIGGDIYLKSLFLTGELGFNPNLAVRNTVNFLIKAAPFLAAIGATVLLAARRPEFRTKLWADWGFRFAVIGALLSTALMVPGSAKDGAGENYFFVPSLYMGLWAVVAAARLAETKFSSASARRLFFGLLSAGWVTNAVAILIVLGGVRGVVSIAGVENYYQEGRACVAKMPKPVFVEEFYLELPWINPSRPVVYPAYNYAFQRRQGYTFERDGVGGMIRDGHFKALMLKKPDARFDGADLSDFNQVGTCVGLYLFVRRPPS